MTQLLLPLLANFAMISIMISLWSYIDDVLERHPRWIHNAAFGLVCGLTGALIMLLPFEPAPGFRFDMRFVPIILAGFFAGPLGAVIATACICAGRIAIGGAGTQIGLIGLVPVFATGLLNYYIQPLLRSGSVRLFVLAASGSLAALTTVLILPGPVRAVLLEHGDTLLTLVLAFSSTLLSAAAMDYDQRRKEIGRINRVNTAVIHALPDCLNVKDLDGRFLIANSATASLMGAEDESALIGKTDFDFYPADAANTFLADERAVLRERKPRTIEQNFVDAGGRTVWLSTLKAPFENDRGEIVGLITHNRDISMQKRLEDELAVTQQYLSDALAEMEDGLLMFDREGRLVLSNSRYHELLPASAPPISIGMRLSDLLEQLVASEIILPDGVSPKAWVGAHMSRKISRSEFQLSDGRFIGRRTTRRPDGGSVTLFSDITAKKLAEEKLKSLAQIDGLTGLLNRRTFDERLYTEFARSYRDGSDLGAVMIDLDRFKAYNDTYGHPAGDECLRQVSECLRACCRPTDVVARYGGEELVALFPNTGARDLSAMAARLHQEVRKLGIPHAGSEKGIVTISVGTAVYSENSTIRKPAELLRLCDEALYQAKGAGRDCVRMAEDDSVAKLAGKQ